MLDTGVGLDLAQCAAGRSGCTATTYNHDKHDSYEEMPSPAIALRLLASIIVLAYDALHVPTLTGHPHLINRSYMQGGWFSVGVSERLPLLPASDARSILT
jgi:hypothetical protein